MAPHSTRLIALSILIGFTGCGITKAGDSVGVDPAGGASGVGGGPGRGDGTSGAGGSGSDGEPLTGPGGGGIGGGGGAASGGQPDSGQGGLGSATGGTTATGSGGVTGSSGANGTGGGRPTETGGVGGAVAGSGGSIANATGGMGSSASGGRSSTGGMSGIGSGGVTSTGGVGGLPGGTGSGGTSWVNGACDSPYLIPTDVSHVDVDVGNLERADTVNLPCATSAKVVVLSFNLMQPEVVYADTLGAGWDTVLAFADACDGTWNTLGADGTTACSDDACGTSQSQAVALLGYGQHFLYVGGARGTRGVATVHFQHAPVGSGPLVMLPPGTGSAQGTTEGRGAVNLCQASGADNSYWWRSCPSYAGGSMTASTCGGAAFDTVLSLQIPGSGLASCADDDPACGVQSKMSAKIPAGAGIYVLTVDGTAGSDSGHYTLTFTRP